ncbi:hypothetical protein V1525DRAFT_405866 [Lipomyces kononenkoae]|uniref:Uncharacterized protein n=1 Tax=Lipomyces kononenkoae TaxID=34357 RepID=A0ACC3SYR1_LIPKO
MEYTSSAYSWFDKISSTFNIRARGFILIDSNTGLCIDVRGVAKKEDAARLYITSKDAIDESGNGVVEFRNSRILLRREPNCLIGLYTEAMR